MSKENISDTQGIKIVILFIFGSTLVMGTGGEAGRAMWVAITLAVVFSIPAYLVYSRILSLFPGKDLFEILELNFGKVFGKLLSLLFVWFAFHLGALVIRNFGEFISTVGLPETPRIVPMIIFALVCIWGVKAGIEVLARCSDYFIVFVIGLLIIYSVLAIPNMDPDNIQPILEKGFGIVLKGVFTSFAYPFGESVVFLLVFSALKDNKSSYRSYIPALLISGMILTYTALRNIMIMGPLTLETVYFPAYAAISRINVGNFLQRLEIGVTIVFLLSGFIKVSVCLLGATKGLTRILGFDDFRILVLPVGLLMTNLAHIIYKDIDEMFEWAFKVWPYYAFPFQVILPLFIWIFIEIKMKMKRSNQQFETEGQDVQT